MKTYASIDESGFPVIRIEFTGEKSTDENFQHYLNATEACYRHQSKLGILFDATNASIPSLRHQQLQADWLKKHEGLMKEFCVGTAYVIPNIAIRAILKMIFSFQKQPVPYEIFEKIADAESWVRRQLNAY
jgi:hypothetical protein